MSVLRLQSKGFRQQITVSGNYCDFISDWNLTSRQLHRIPSRETNIIIK